MSCSEHRKERAMQPGAATECGVALVGASTLKGREVAAVWRERSLTYGRLTLLEAEEETGIEGSSEEKQPPLQLLRPKDFENAALAIFAASPGITEQYWQMAYESGCQIVDLSYGLETRTDAGLRALVVENFLECSEEARLEGRLWVAAHPAAIAIASILGQLGRNFPLVRSTVTVLEPASERGLAAVEELHRQTVNLLSFQPIPRNVFDAQVAFNLLSCCGSQCQPSLEQAQERIRNHTRRLLAGRAAVPAVRVVQAPVFYGYTLSCYVEFSERISPEALEEVLDHSPFAVRRDADCQPNVVETAGSNEILLGRVEPDLGCETGYWLWVTMDNLRVAALNAVEIAEQWLTKHLQQSNS